MVRARRRCDGFTRSSRWRPAIAPDSRHEGCAQSAMWKSALMSSSLERLAATDGVAVVAHLHRDGFVEHALAHAGSQTTGGDDVDRAAEQVRQVHDQAAEVQQDAARLQVDEEINVAGGIRLATGHGTEHADVVGTMLPGELKDLLAAAGDLIRRIGRCSDGAWHVGRFTSCLGKARRHGDIWRYAVLPARLTAP